MDREAKMKDFIRRIPVIGGITQSIYRRWINPYKEFRNSEDYWIDRYQSGRNSGSGSYGKLALFKAEILNNFVESRRLKTVIEYGCGDGNQLKLAKYPAYIGFDVSKEAVTRCKEMFIGDSSKTFMMMNDYKEERSDLAISLDVIYHLVEQNVFNDYMNRLFDSAEKYVIIYSSNTNKNKRVQSPHVKHRQFTDWIQNQKSEWKLLEHVPNKHPFMGSQATGSHSDFYIYERSSQAPNK